MNKWKNKVVQQWNLMKSHYVVEQRASTGLGVYLLFACKDNATWAHDWVKRTHDMKVVSELTCKKCANSWERIEAMIEEGT